MMQCSHPNLSQANKSRSSLILRWLTGFCQEHILSPNLSAPGISIATVFLRREHTKGYFCVTGRFEATSSRRDMGLSSRTTMGT
ncbi:hypothetical protein LINPERHAP1_LOCUS14272 [Linum perenne]